MAITSTEGAHKGRTFLALYELEGNDTLRICDDRSGTDFPKASHRHGELNSTSSS